MKKYLFTFILIIDLLFCNDYSINFDGQNDFINISDHSDLDLTNNYTLEAWIFPESFSWLAGIISKYQTSAANGYILRLTSQSPFSGIGFDEKITSTGVLNANQWHHIAAVNNNGQRKLYINGILTSISGSALNVVSNSDPIRIGSDYSSRFFDGRIDEVRIWNTARDQNDITSTMDSTLSGTEDGLVAYYNFNEGSGIILNDLTGNGHDGTVVGGLWASGYSLSGLIGDINFDEVLNVYDAVMLVAIMLGNENANQFQQYACDSNQDGSLTIEDVVLLMQWILDIDITARSLVTSVGFKNFDNVLEINSDGDVAGLHIELSEDINISNINFPAGWNWEQKGNNLIAYSLNGSSMPRSFKIKSDNHMAVNSVKVVDWSGKSIQSNKNILPNISSLKVSPNPFNSMCTISFMLRKSNEVTLILYNIKGELVAQKKLGLLYEGNHEISWSPDNFPSGTYFMKTQTASYSEYSKILYLK